jgi:hypothetical protein
MVGRLHRVEEFSRLQMFDVRCSRFEVGVVYMWLIG